jgi:hypothetical protein
MTDTIESLRARITQALRERDAARAEVAGLRYALEMAEAAEEIANQQAEATDYAEAARSQLREVELANARLADKRDAARADAARLAEALRRERNVIAEWHPDAEDPASMVLVRIDAALAAHDAGTPPGGVWLTAEEVETVWSWASAVPVRDWRERDVTLSARLRKARGGGA